MSRSLRQKEQVEDIETESPMKLETVEALPTANREWLIMKTC